MRALAAVLIFTWAGFATMAAGQDGRLLSDKEVFGEARDPNGQILNDREFFGETQPLPQGQFTLNQVGQNPFAGETPPLWRRMIEKGAEGTLGGLLYAVIGGAGLLAVWIARMILKLWRRRMWGAAMPFNDEHVKSQDFQELVRRIDAEEINILLNETTLNVPGSPVYSAFDNFINLFLCLAAILLSIFLAGPWVGAAVSAIAILVFLVLGKIFILDRVNRRACELVVSSEDAMNAFLDAHAIMLQDKAMTRRVSKSEDWRILVRDAPVACDAADVGK